MSRKENKISRKREEKNGEGYATRERSVRKEKRKRKQKVLTSIIGLLTGAGNTASLHGQQPPSPNNSPN